MTRPVDNTEVSVLPRSDGDAGPGTSAERQAEPWRDPALSADERLAELLTRMTLAEKVAQLGSIW